MHYSFQMYTNITRIEKTHIHITILKVLLVNGTAALRSILTSSCKTKLAITTQQPASALWVIYLRKIKTQFPQSPHAEVHSVSLLTAEHWKRPRCPSAGERRPQAWSPGTWTAALEPGDELPTHSARVGLRGSRQVKRLRSVQATVWLS